MKKIGIIGGGQLGQMLGQAGASLDLEFQFLDPNPQSPASSEGSVLEFAFDDPAGLASLAQFSDCVTYEFENIPVSAIAALGGGVPVYPPAEALERAQDRLAEKNLFSDLGIPVGEYRAIDSSHDLQDAIREIGLPIVLKTRRLGYDGKGQYVIRDAGDCRAALSALGDKDLIAEQWIPFDRELSVIGVRSVSGEIVIYALSENRHDSGILRVSRAPTHAPATEQLAERYLADLLERLDYVGTLALELFDISGKILANEFAPRVHNSGHWTIEGAATSQFENHLRAILDLPLGNTAMRGYAGMLNLIGEMPAADAIPAMKGIYLHDYGKSPRPGRKLGHITVVDDSSAARDERLDELAEKLKN